MTEATQSTPELLPSCPFCSATPHRGPTKVQHDQLHGEPFQRFAIWCPHGCARIERVSEAVAITAWSTRSTPDRNAVLELLREASGYVIGNHDEGCELDAEFGEQALEASNDRAFEEDADAELRDWPDDAVCTCGTAELLARIDAALTTTPEPKP